MDPARFDALTRKLTRAASSRRWLLRGLAGSTLSGLAAAGGVADAGASHFDCRHVGKPCARRSQCCSGRCRGEPGAKTCVAHHAGDCTATTATACTLTSSCNGNSACRCYATTGNAPFCGESTGDCGSGCTTDKECVDRFATPGAACVAGCCGDIGACVRPCFPQDFM